MSTISTSATPLEIFATVSQVLQECLAVEEDEITLEKSIPFDLGASSVDLLDIIFRLQQALKIQLRVDEVFPRNVRHRNLEDHLTNEILETIQNALPFKTGLGHTLPEETTIGGIITVRLLCQAVAHRLNVPWSDPVIEKQ